MFSVPLVVVKATSTVEPMKQGPGATFVTRIVQVDVSFGPAPTMEGSA
jgi:hypothetical protein